MSHEKVARDCLHEPKCLFKCREVFLLCRSNPELDKCVCESEYDCFKRVVRKRNSDEEQNTKQKRKDTRRVTVLEEVWKPMNAKLKDGMLQPVRYELDLNFNQRRYAVANINKSGIGYQCKKYRAPESTAYERLLLS